MNVLAPDFHGLWVYAWMLGAVGYATSLGWLLLQRLQGPHAAQLPALLSTFVSASTGFAVTGTALFVLGLIGALHSWGLGLGLGLLWLGAAWLARPAIRWPRWHPPRWATWPSAVVLAVLGLSLVWRSIGPPGMWDDTSYHLPVARHYLQHAGLEVNPWLRFPLFAHHVNLLLAVALHWGSEVHAQAVANAIPLTLIAMGLVGLSQWQFRTCVPGWLAVGLLSVQAPLKEALGYAYIDNWLMLYVWAAFVALYLALQAAPAQRRTWVMVCAVLAGAAASSKLFGAFIVVLLGLVLLSLWGPKNKLVWTYGAVAALFGLGWYVRSFIISGDPLHPAGGDLFGHYLWNADDLLQQKAEQRTHGGSTNPLDLWASLLHAGIAPLAAGLLVLVQPRLWRTAALPLALLMLVYWLLWQAFFPPVRYTLPVLPLGAYLVVTFFHEAGLGETWQRLQRVRVLSALGHGLAAAAAVLVCATVPRQAFEGFTERVTHWQANLHARSGYALMQAANQRVSSHGQVLVHLGYENAIYFFQGTAIGDWFGPGRYAQMMKCEQRCGLATPEVILPLLDRMNARMIAVNAARFAFDPEPYRQAFDIQQVGPTDYLLLRRP